MSEAHRSDHRWVKLRKQRLTIARTHQEHCCRCGKPIDYTLHGNDRDGPTVDHLDPIATGGDPYPPLDQLGIAHRHCNSRHGQRISNARQGLGPGSRGGNPATYQKSKRRSKINTRSKINNGGGARSTSSPATSQGGYLSP